MRSARVAVATAALLAAVSAPAHSAPGVGCLQPVEGAAEAATCRVRIRAVLLPQTDSVDVSIEVLGPFECSYDGVPFGGPAGGGMHTLVPYAAELDIPVDCTPLEAVPPCTAVGSAVVAAGSGMAGGRSTCGTLSAGCSVAMSFGANACADTARGLSFYPWRCTLTIRPWGTPFTAATACAVA